MSTKGASGTIMSIIKTPLGIIMLFIIMLVLSGLTIASAISGELTAAAVGSAGLLTVIVLLVAINVLGKN